MHSALISCENLDKIIHDQSVKIVDASWHMPAEQRDARAEYEQMHLPGAVFFDLDATSDPASPYPHMLPSQERFGQKMGELGIGNQDFVVIYDSVGLFSAPRAWWMFRVFGHAKVAVLAGGLPQWRAEGRPVERGAVPPAPAIFHAGFRPELVRHAEEVRAGDAQLLDARAADRFFGRVPEPREGLRSGHIPGSRNLPWPLLLTPDKTAFKPLADMARLFKEAGIDPEKPVVTTCGSGVSACILALALHEMGHAQVPVYDGSWAEWGSRADLPLATD